MPFKRGSTYHTYIRVPGQKPTTRSLGTSDKAEAIRRERDLQSNIWAQRNLGARPVVTFDEALLEWHRTGLNNVKANTRKRYLVSSRRLHDHFAGTQISAVKRANISSYINSRRGEGVSDQTIKNDLVALSALFRDAVNRDWVERNPMKDFDTRQVASAKRRDRILTPDEEQRLLDASPNMLKAMIIVALETGMRWDELRTLRWEQVVDIRIGEQTTPVIQLGTSTKNSRARSIPLTKRAHASIRAFKNYHAYVWAQGPNNLPPTSVQRQWNAALKKAGITDFRWHDLRHCAATAWRKSGMSIDRIMELLGHSSLNMVLRYASLHPDNLIDAIQTFEKGRAASKTQAA